MPRGYRHSTTRLDNGLTVVTVAMPHLHSASVSLFVRAGSRHERGADRGLAHFLEHMLFRGCDGYPDSTALNMALEDLGGELDGYTTRDHSGYEATVHPGFVADAVEILGRMMAGPLFTEIAVERAIVLEEMLESVDNRGRRVDVEDVAYEQAFADHPLCNPIDGTRQNVRRFGIADLRRQWRRLYGACNMVLAFCGDVDPARCRRAARRWFGGLPKGRPVRDGPRPPLPEHAPSMRFCRADQALSRVRLSFRTVPEPHRDHVALVMLRRILDGGLSARLPAELVERRGLAYEVSSDLECFSDCGLFNIGLAVAHRSLGPALDVLASVLAGLRSEPVPADELDRVKRRARIWHDFLLDAPLDLAHWFGACRLFFTPPPPERRLRDLEGIGGDRLRAAAQRYLRPERLTAAAIGGADPGVKADARRAFRALCESLR